MKLGVRIRRAFTSRSAGLFVPTKTCRAPQIGAGTAVSKEGGESASVLLARRRLCPLKSASVSSNSGL
jgi:hypothetical protein